MPDQDETPEPSRHSTPESSSPNGMPPQQRPCTETKQETSEQGVATAKQVARELHWLEKLNIFVQMGLVAVGIIAAIIYGRQLHEMRRTNDLTAAALGQNDKTLQQTLAKMQAQIDVGKFANDLSKQSIVANQSASVITESPRPVPLSSDLELVHHQALYIYYSNVGKTKTGKFHSSAVLTRRRLPGYHIIDGTQQRSVSGDRMKPVEQLLVGTPGFRTDDVHIGFDMSSFTQHDLDRINSLEEAIEISGYTEYGDGFGNNIKQPFCFLYASFPRRTIGQIGAVTGEGGNWGMCGDMRRAIAEALDWKTSRNKN